MADLTADLTLEEPEPIMVYEEEEDENLAAILDAEVGLRRRDGRK